MSDSEYSKYLNPIKGKNISFVGPEWDGIDVNEIELVSESLLNIFLNDFFNPGIINKEILEQACHQEMIDRGYL